MKRSLPLLSLLITHALAADSSIPTAFSPDRYTTMIAKSPFALATPTVVAPPPPPPQASFAANWYLTAVGRDPDGQDFVTIKAQDGSAHFSLTGRDADLTTGVSIASVDWSDTFRKSTAILKKGTETAKLIFSQEEAQPAAPTPNRNFRVGGGPSIPIPVPNPGINPGIPPQGTTGALFNQTPNPTSPRGFVPPRPTTNGLPPVITPAPSPVANPIGTPVTIANPGQPLNSATPPSDTRRRIRTIAAP